MYTHTHCSPLPTSLSSLISEHTTPSGGSSNRRRNKLDLPPVSGGLSQPDSLHYSSKYVAHRHSKKRRSPSSSPSHHPRPLGELDISSSGVPATQLGSSSRIQRSLPGNGKSVRGWLLFSYACLHRDLARTFTAKQIIIQNNAGTWLDKINIQCDEGVLLHARYSRHGCSQWLNWAARIRG